MEGMEGIVAGSALAALFSVCMFVIMRFEPRHDKLSSVIPFSILILIGNVIFNPLVQKDCSWVKGYAIGLIAALIYLVCCVIFDLIKWFLAVFSIYFKDREEELQRELKDLRDLRELLDKMSRQ